MNQFEQLKRDGHLLAKPIRPKKKHGLRRASPKRQEQNKQYLKLRREFLRAYPWCQIASQSAFQIPTCGHKATEIHHKSGRGKNLLKMGTWMSICRSCHNWIHSHPKEARALGLLK